MNYRLSFSPQSIKDIRKIKESGDFKLYNKLSNILDELLEHPNTGTGKPELLKHYEKPTWSRRLSRQHRLIYTIEDRTVTVYIISAWGHYDDK